MVRTILTIQSDHCGDFDNCHAIDTLPSPFFCYPPLASALFSALPCPAPTLLYPALPCPDLSYPVLPNLTLPYPALPCLTLPYPTMYIFYQFVSYHMNSFSSTLMHSFLHFIPILSFHFFFSLPHQHRPFRFIV